MKIKHLIAQLCTVLPMAFLTGCGGGSSAPSTPPPDPVPAPTPNVVSITAAAEAKQNRLACNKEMVDVECGLRTYQIMVEAFVDGDNTADYNAGYGTSNHKGDLKGITASLDYIKSLGMNAIWLTPIFKSASTSGQDLSADRLDATGYFATDYFSIDPKFGTLADAQDLVAQAHAKGLYVFFDGVFGHHKAATVAPSPNNLTPVGGNDPVDYTNVQTLNFYKEVATYWITNLKIDGWRLDQAYQVPTSAWSAIRTAVQTESNNVTYTMSGSSTAVHPLGYMVAEVFSGESDIASQAYGTTLTPALNSAFDFPTRYKLVQTLATQEDTGASNARVPTGINLNSAFASYAAYPDHAKPNLMIGNHDVVRFGDLVQRAGLANPTDAEYWTRHKAAFSFLAAHSGPITVYYNDEIGAEVPGFAASVQSGCADLGLCDDHVARSQAIIEGVATTFGGTPAVLTAEQSNLKDYVSMLMQARADNPALSIGSRTHIFSNANLFIDRKDAGTNHVLYILNTQKTIATITLDASVIGVATPLTDLMDASTIDVNGASKYVITVPALGSRILRF